jgi:hypothetical protein
LCSLGFHPSRFFPLNNGIHASSAANNGNEAIPPTNARRESFTDTVYVHEGM